MLGRAGPTHSERRVRKFRQIVHTVKSWPQFFEPMLSGVKTHDVRRVTDRNYQAGDLLRLQEFDPQSESFTGRELLVRITYVTSSEYPCALSEQALNPNYCILSVTKDV